MGDTSEQWNLEGRCELCRKGNYCKKYCKARDKYIRESIRKQVEATPYGQLMKLLQTNIGGDLKL